MEHATIHLLTQAQPALNVVGRTTQRGFYLYGDVSTELVAAAAAKALARLHQGHNYLAIHPRCGTNLAVTGILAGLLVFAVNSGRRRSWLDRLPLSLLAALTGVLAAQPLGYLVQERLTTSVRDLPSRVHEVTRLLNGKIITHRVDLEWE